MFCELTDTTRVDLALTKMMGVAREGVDRMPGMPLSFLSFPFSRGSVLERG